MHKVIKTFILTDDELNLFIKNQQTDFIKRTVSLVRIDKKLFIFVIQDNDEVLQFTLEDFAKIVQIDISEFY